MASVKIVEELRVFKEVCNKIRTTLVAGREEVVSPRAVTKSFLDRVDRIISTPSTKNAENGPGPWDNENTTARWSSECPFVEKADGWTVEYCETNCESCGAIGHCMCNHPIPNLDLHSLPEASYRQFFYQQDHWNYYTDEPDTGPCVLSIKQEPVCERFRILVRSSDHYLHGLLYASEVGANMHEREEVVSAIGKEMNLLTFFKIAQQPNIQEDLLKIDETFVKSHHKVGVIRVRQGQRSEEEIFGNEHETGPFDEFLNVLGRRIKLQGFTGFLGGLDKERNLTGEQSVYTEFRNLDIMFHVATLLPYTAHDAQQVNKKRHIGNDIVCVVFLDNSHTSFNPSWIRSHFIHCYVVVQHVVGAHGQPLYKVAVTKRSTVPLFSPELRYTRVFAHSKTLQQFLLTKVVNGERASYHAPKFLRLTNRSRAQLLMEMVAGLTEFSVATKQGRATRKISKRSNWLPIGASRPPSPLVDPVREKFSNSASLTNDFKHSFRGCELADVVFIVGEDHIPLYAVKAILACRSRVFRHMFKEGKTSGARFTSPLSRRRISSSSGLHHITSSPQLSRKTVSSSSRSLLGRRKKSGTTENLVRSVSPERMTSPLFSCDDSKGLDIKEQYVIEGFNDTVFGEVLRFLMTGGCTIRPSIVVGLACAAEKYDIPDLKEACIQRLPDCLTVRTICSILTKLEKYLSFAVAKKMIVQCLEFVDNNAYSILTSKEFLDLSENMVHLVLRREDSDVDEIVKVKAAFAWGELNTKSNGPDFKTLVTPLVKHVKLHLIDPQEIMKIIVPSEVFDTDKVMTALAYQVDPQSVEKDNFTMFRPRKKSNVLSSR